MQLLAKSLTSQIQTENPDGNELTPEMLANISGGRKSTEHEQRGFAIRPPLSINMDIGNMPETKAA